MRFHTAYMTGLLLTGIVLAVGSANAEVRAYATIGVPSQSRLMNIPGPIDRGGSVMDYLLRNDGPQRIEGTCMSACTLKLGARIVCVVVGTARSPATVLWFHAPSGVHARTHGRYLMLRAYMRFPRVAAWVKSRNALGFANFKIGNTLTGWQLVRMGVPKCT